MERIEPDHLDKVTGGYIVDDSYSNKYWIVRQNGTVIAPAPSLDLAIEFAKEFGTSPSVLTMGEYKAKFGRELVW